jgi:hypothetical protein
MEQKRRERINERLKILQNLVPNGTKASETKSFRTGNLIKNRTRGTHGSDAWTDVVFRLTSARCLRKQFNTSSSCSSRSRLVPSKFWSQSCWYRVFPMLITQRMQFFLCWQLLSSDDMWMFAPIAYNGVNVGLDIKISLPPQ